VYNYFTIYFGNLGTYQQNILFHVLIIVDIYL